MIFRLCDQYGCAVRHNENLRNRQQQANTDAASHFTVWNVIKSHFSANQPRSHCLYSSSSTPCFLQVWPKLVFISESDGSPISGGLRPTTPWLKESAQAFQAHHWNEAPGQTHVPFEYMMQYDGKLYLKAWITWNCPKLMVIILPRHNISSVCSMFPLYSMYRSLWGMITELCCVLVLDKFNK